MNMQDLKPIHVIIGLPALGFAMCAGGCGCLMMLAGISSPPAPTQARTPERTVQQAAHQEEAPARPPVDATLTYPEIRNAAENLTSLQWNDYAQSLKGKRVRWQGWVSQSKEKFFGGYEVLVDMDPPGTVLSVQDVYFDVDEGTARALNLNQPIRFEGTIRNVLKTLGHASVTLDDVDVL
jgi:hypothetical protein